MLRSRMVPRSPRGVAVLMVLALGACTSIHTITKEDLVRQIEQHGRVIDVFQCDEENRCRIRVGGWPAVERRERLGRILGGRGGDVEGRRWYSLAGIKHLTCVNGKQERVRLKIDVKSQVIVHTHDGGKAQFYLWTGEYDGELLVGLRSVMLETVTVIPLRDVSAIEIYSEFPWQRKL